MSANLPNDNTNDPFEIAKQVLSHMAKHGVEPAPESFAVWYHYVVQDIPALSQEIDADIAKAADFNEASNQHLYKKYIAVSDVAKSSTDASDQATKDAQVIEDAAEDANKMMAELMATVMHFSGEASGYEEEMGGQIQKMNAATGDDDKAAMMQQFMATAVAMREGSASLNKKLEESQKEIEMLKGNLEQVKKESEKDFLTGVYNRKALDKKLKQSIDAFAEKSEPLCVLMMDIDHFKKFNDTYGHQIGDQVLKIVAQSLMGSVKGSDTVARYGGEEFSVILPSTPIGGAVAVAESIRKAIASKELKRRDTGENYGQITMSIGVAMFRAGEDDVESLLKRADEALYKSKQDGRNRVTMEPA